MKHEKSCGAVVFKREGGIIKYLLISSRTGVWGFPKGHVEAGESDEETALREVREETRLAVKLHNDHLARQSYTFRRGEEIIGKEVVLFLAEYEGQEPVAQESEIAEIRLLPFSEALTLISFEDTREILKDADTAIKNMR